MEIIIQPDAQTASLLAAKIIAALVRTKPAAVLGLATGSTPVGVYQELIRMRRIEGLDFSRVTTFNLDEYVGLPPEHPASYHHFMRVNLFDSLAVSPERIHIPDGLATDVPRCCQRYEEQIRQAGGIDLQLLGIGHDGHIGFNEPSSSLASRTRIKTLTQQTREANARFFPRGEEVPSHVITMGIGTIMEASCCLVLAFGQEKACAVAAMAEGPISASCPASALQWHRDTRLVVDEEAATLLAHADYYRYVYGRKPAFQRLPP
jgi:glucosamine-6-phosphate deaminase